MKLTAKQCAIGLLARRDHSKLELKQKLLTKGYAPEEVESVLSELSQKKLIKESHFAENYVHSRRQKGFGPLRIMMELKAKGLTDEVIAEAIKIADNAWFTEVHKVWYKRFNSKKIFAIKSRENLAKQIRFLQYRGYTKEQIDSVIKDKDNYGNE